MITRVGTTPATRQDVEETEGLLEAEREAGRTPKKALVDTGYISGPIVEKMKEKGIKIVGPVLPDPSMQEKGGYGTSVFKIDWEKKQATCPEGETSKYWNEKKKQGEAETVLIKFAGKVCQGCVMKEKCTTSQTGGRTLNIYSKEVHELLQKRRSEQGGKAFQEEYAPRSGIEGTISEGVRAHGMRRSKYKGMKKTHLQMISIAGAINLIRINSMLERKKANLPPRRKRAASPFARLRPANAV